jgi:hypothetical protein
MAQKCRKVEKSKIPRMVKKPVQANFQINANKTAAQPSAGSRSNQRKQPLRPVSTSQAPSYGQKIHPSQFPEKYRRFDCPANDKKPKS